MAINELMTCPKCGHIYAERPALSRVDNATLICPDCGTQEALVSLHISQDEQTKIKATIKQHRPTED